MIAKILRNETAYDGWLSVARLTVAMPNGAIEERHVEDHGSAVALLPFDPVRRTAILITQPRMPVVLAGREDILEAIAGRLESQGPDGTARKEALEEAGLRIGALEQIALIWSMPAVSTERIHLFLAEYEAIDRVATGGGAADENECITVHELALAEIASMTADGRIEDAKTLLLVQALQLRRPELFEPNA